MANQRARGKIYQGSKKGSSARNDNTRTLTSGVKKPRILSSKDSEAVGRPGFKNVGGVPGPVDGKQSVRRLMVRDPAVGREQPSADAITTTDVDLIGVQNPTILSAQGVQKAFSSGKKTVSSGQPSGGPKSRPVKR